MSLADPTSPWTFLNYLRSRERLFPFYFAERFHIQRAEYDAYCRWVGESLPDLHFGHQVDAVRWNPERDVFEVDFTQLDADGEAEALGRTYARNVVLGIGTEPYVPEPLKPLAQAPGVPVVHAADYLDHRAALLAAEHVTVVGIGQSGAEIFLDLLRNRPAGQEKLHWLGRTEAFAPMEYSKLGLEHFTPDHTRYFHALPESARDRLVTGQWQLHKGIDATTVAAIHDELYRRTLHGGWPDAVLTPASTSAPRAASPRPRWNCTWSTAGRTAAPGSPPTPSSSPPATANAPSTVSSPASTPTCAGTAGSARVSTRSTASSSTRPSPARRTSRTPRATPTASAPPTSASPPGAARSSSTP